MSVKKYENFIKIQEFLEGKNFEIFLIFSQKDCAKPNWFIN